ncbi:MAG: hypothetical protein GY716_18215, partial [bacterium]|nr:hypothetical protein [bacterium]
GVEQDGFRVIYGNILDERSMQRAQLEDRTSCLAVTTNEEVNLLVARTVAEDFKIEHCYVALRKDRPHVTETLVRGADAEVVFGEPRDLELWDVRLRRGTVSLEPWSLEVRPGNLDLDVRDERPFAVLEGVLLPMVAQRGQHAAPVNSKTLFRKGDIVHFAIFDEQRQQAYDWLEERGWLRVPDAEAAEEELTEKEPAKAVDEEPERELTPA